MVRIRIRDVEFSYASVPILKNICMEVAESEILGIIGPNGAGKSTLLRCIDRILSPQKGTIFLNERDISKMSRLEIAKRMGYIPQSTTQVFPATVFETVLMGRRPHISWRCNERDVEKVLEVLHLLDLEGLAMRDINELSGGQQQKVFIARALVQEPDVLLLDEPTSNLDIKHQLEVMDIIKEIARKRGISAIMAIHDLNLAARYADRLIMMKNGMIYAAGEHFSVLTPENIREVYGVEVEVSKHNGRPFVIPLRPTTATTSLL